MITIISYFIILFAVNHQFSNDGSNWGEILPVTAFQNNSYINKDGKTIETRFVAPTGFVRQPAQNNSFASYLRQLPLKPDGSSVKLYNGNLKGNQQAHIAVVDLPIGTKDLHQCADAIMRLRAEFLFNQKKYDKIHFNFTNGFRADYQSWTQGKRIVVSGNKASWQQQTSASTSQESFWKYLEKVFTYAGTLSLAKELQPVKLADIKIGDVFIKGGSPGHAVIVVDMVYNSTTQEKRFLLAQSYMPAQEIQVLQNPANDGANPWYTANLEKSLITPEWTFLATDLKRFNDN